MFSAPASIAFVVAMFVVATIPTMVTPLLVDVWREAFGWSEADLGLVAALELGGFACGAASALYWQKRWSWRPLAAGALVVMAGANAACAFVDTLALMGTARLLCGIGAGIVSGIHLAFVANTRSPGRIIAIVTLCQLLTQAAVFLLAEPMAEAVGTGGLYALMAGSTALCLGFLQLLPKGWPPESVEETEIGTGGVPFLLAFLPYGAFQSGVFAFFGFLGSKGAGLDAHQISKAIGISVFGSALGPIGAFVLDRRAGLMLPIMASIVIQIVVVALLTMTRYEVWQFIVYISVLQAGWAFLSCYLYIVLIDAAPELTAASIPLTTLSGGIGAFGVGALIDAFGSNGMMIGSAAMLALIAVAICLPLLRRVNGAAVGT